MIFTEDRQDVGQKDTFGDLVRLLAFLVVCFLPFLQERAQYQYTIEREVLANQEVMTSPGYGTAQGVAKGFYNVVMTDLGVYRFLHVTLVNTKTPSDKFEEFWAKFLIVSERIVDNVPLLVYQIGWRLGVVGYWILYFIPFFGRTSIAVCSTGSSLWRRPQGPKSNASRCTEALFATRCLPSCSTC